MENNKTLREFLNNFKGQRIHRINLHYQDSDGKYKEENVEKIDISWADNSELVLNCDRFKHDSWFLNLTERGGAAYYTWIVDEWNLFTDPTCKTREGYRSEEYADELEHDYLCLDMWIKTPNELSI